MTQFEASTDYFEWLCDIVCSGRFSKKVSFKRLLTYLHQTEFTYTILQDENRAMDGVDLRYRFAKSQNHEDELDYLDGPCSILEMMVALAIRCEESIMDNPSKGDRTGQWFWSMIVNLNLGSMTDDRFDKSYIDETIDIFLNREYAPNGCGSLFTILDCEYDLRDMAIWRQMCFYLDTIAAEV